MHRSGCFVATAAYGDEDLIEVHLLRQFRDHYLATTIIGRKFIWIYYRYGPYAAAFIEHSLFLRRLARCSLNAFVRVIERFTPLSRESAGTELRRALHQQKGKDNGPAS